MSKFRKTLSLAAATCIFATSATPAFAQVTGYVTQKDGIEYEYDAAELIASIMNGGSLYTRYLEENLVALRDDQKGLIDADDVINAIINSEGSFDVDNYTESGNAKPSTVVVDKKVSVDASGNVKEEDVVVNTDKEGPVLSYAGETTITVANGASFTAPSVTGTDNVDATVSVTKVIKNAAGTVLEAIDTKVAGTYTITYSAKDAAGNASNEIVITVTVEEAVQELKVESVSAINTNSVVVTITASEEDMLGQEVEVKNGAGTIVAVKPLDIAAGDTTAEFDFVTAVKADDLKGTWTVNGKSYDLDLFTKLDNFLNATTQVKLNEALVALGIENVEIANLPAYKEAQEELALSVDSKDLTVEDVQTLVNDVNAESLTEEEEETLVKAIVKAVTTNNKVLLLSSLKDANITPLNAEWAGDYETALVAITDASPLKDVQTAISDENDVKVQADVVDTGINKQELTDSLALIEKYATVTEAGDYKVGAITTSVEDIEIQLALVEVLEATTPTSFKAKLTALATLLDDPAQLDMDDYIDANGKAYVKALKDETSVAAKNTVSLVEAILFDAATGVNFVEAGTLVTKVTDAATAIDTAETAVPGSTTSLEKTALLKALKNLGVKQVADANIGEYVTLASDFKIVSDLDEAQTQVDTGNVAAVAAADKNTIVSKLNVFGIDNIVSANAQAYVDDLIAITVGANNKATIANAKAAVKTVNDDVKVDALVAKIAKSTNVAETKQALIDLANLGQVANFLATPVADRTFVAEELVAIEDRTTVDTEGKIDTLIGTPINDKITAVVDAAKAVTRADNADYAKVKLVLAEFEAYTDLGALAKVDAEIAFYNLLTFVEATPNTPAGTDTAVFTSYTQVKTLVNQALGL